MVKLDPTPAAGALRAQRPRASLTRLSTNDPTTAMPGPPTAGSVSTGASGSEGANGERRPRPKWLLALTTLLGVALAAIAIALAVVYGRGEGHKAASVPSAIQAHSVAPPEVIKAQEHVGLDAVLADLTGEVGATTDANVQEGTFTDLGKGPAGKSGAGAATIGPELPTITVDESVYGIPNTRDGNTAGEKILGTAAALAAATGGAQGDGACRVANAAELRAAITEKTCPIVILTSSARDAYVLLEEIVVRRSVVVMGNSIMLPFIDCAESVRAFRVVAGAYLELQFVRVNIGQGVTRPRVGIFRDRRQRKAQADGNEKDEEIEEEVWREMTEQDLEALTPEERQARKLQLGGQGAEAEPLEVIEIRGGTVLFEPGALGGSFNGVYFTSDQTDVEDVMIAIEQTVNLVGIRIWGGHVLVAGGTVTFNGCIFYDLELLTPFSDRIYFGGDVLVLAGTVYFTGCAWFYTTVIGTENGLGFNVATFAGASIFTACHFQEQNAAAAYNGVGQAFIVLGGVQIVTGCNFIYFSAVEFFSGTGELTVLAGVQVVTGVSWEEYYGTFAYYGCGLDYAVMAGVLVQTGATLNQWSGPIWGSVAGDYVFVGAGSYTAHGAPVAQYTSIGGESGSGCLSYVATGTAVFIGAPVFDVSGIWTTFAVGEYYGVSSGFLVIIGSPFIEIAGIEYFQGLGGTCYLGAGAAVMGYSPQIEMVALKNEHFDFWFTGSCEPEHHAWAPGKPFYIPPGLGCIEHEEHEEGDHEGEEEGHGHEDGHDDHPDDHRRALLQQQHRLAAASLGAFLSPEQDFVLVGNVTKTRLRVDDAAQAQLLQSLRTPSGVLEAARSVDSLRSALGVVTKEDDPDALATIYIHDTRDGYCGLCGVDSVAGPGAATCEITESCEQLATPFGGKDSTAAALIDYESLDYKEQFILTADLDTLLPASSPSSKLAPADVQAAVTEALLAEEDGVADSEDPLDALQVTVHDAQADPMLKAHFPEYFPDKHDRELANFHRRMAEGPADVAQRFKVSIVATSRARQQSVLAAMQPQLDEASGVVGEADGSSALESALKDFFLLEKGIELGATRLSVDQTLYVPAYNDKALFANDASKPTGTFSVSLVDPQQPALPITHAHYGTRYAVQLSNFPPGSQVSLRLVRKQATGAATEQSWVLDPALQVDEAGTALAFHTFQPPHSLLSLRPQQQQPPGDYYFEATDAASGIYNFSPVFALSDQQRRRKLYGPIMWA